MAASGIVVLRMTVVPLAAVLAGHLTGSQFEFFRCHSLLWPTSLAALAFLAWGAGWAWLVRRRIQFALAIYAVAVMVIDPICAVDNPGDVLRAVILLLPVVLGLVLVLQRGPWPLAIGTGLALFAATTALTFNVRHQDAGLSFFSGWIS